jgi:hypothetical protein
MKRAIVFLGLTFVCCVFGLLVFVKNFLPNVGDPEGLKIVGTPERIARGNYLANNVAACMDCHSTRDWTKFSGPLIKGSLGKGGEIFAQEFGFPGRYVSKNITPFGVGDWTDGELLRAISTGVNKDGKALFPIMPHPNYGKMDKEDLIAIIAYIRTLEPIEYVPEVSESDFPMNFIINTIPKKANFSRIPSTTDQIAYGSYLFNVAACNECHTKQEKGKAIKGMELAGGFEFPLGSGGIVRSANISPDMKTGIGSWSEQLFVSKFKMFDSKNFDALDVEAGKFNTVMPWTMYGNMTEEDLKAIFAYIKTRKPIKNKVVKFTE